MQYTEFDKQDIYELKIQPKVAELVKICSREDIPLFVAACTKNDENGTEYQKEAVTPGTHDIKLKDDVITKFIDVTLGFEVVPPRSIPNLNFE